MQVKNVEKKGNQATIVVEIDKELMETGINKAYTKARKSIMIPGFRKGKAPRKMIEAMYGTHVFYEDGLEEIFPEIEDDSQDVEIRPEDYEMQVYRSSGAGGQHINKTSSAVRLIHKATGIVVSCQTERSQFQNKETCLKMLRSKLVEIKEREHLDKISDIKGVQQKIEWGSQIRNYVFMPYTLVKDTRTGCETSNVNAVMDGALDPFIESYLNCLATGNWVQK